MRYLILFALLACASLAQAHDLWLEKSGKHWTLYQGHRHSVHAGAETMAYGSNFVTTTACLDARGAKRPLAVAGTAPWTASGDCAALLLEMSSGYWSKTPWETKNVPKNEAQGAIRSWLSKDSLKRIEQWAAPFAQPLGQGLEIVPTGDPFALKPDDKLIVRIFLAGKPQANVPVAYHGDTRGETDPDGRIAIRLRHGGVQLISASVELPLKDGKADVEILAATLQFELPK
jgi:nickel transport protein